MVFYVRVWEGDGETECLLNWATWVLFAFSMLSHATHLIEFIAFLSTQLFAGNFSTFALKTWQIAAADPKNKSDNFRWIWTAIDNKKKVFNNLEKGEA